MNGKGHRNANGDATDASTATERIDEAMLGARESHQRQQQQKLRKIKTLLL
jgi:hypothetical protein